MSRFQILAFISLIALTLSIALIGDALAGEKFKVRNSKYMTEWKSVDVGDKEGHVLGVFEAKGITANLAGKKCFDGFLEREVGLVDLDTKSGAVSCQCYTVRTDCDGDKFFEVWEGKNVAKGSNQGTFTLTGGTGKFQEIRGTGTWTSYSLSGTQWYSDVEYDVEFAGR